LLSEQHSYLGKRVKLMERSLFSARYCFVENLKKEDKIHDSEYQVFVI
jgi:Deoxynucleoside kinase